MKNLLTSWQYFRKRLKAPCQGLHTISEKVRELCAIMLGSFDWIMAIAPVEMVLKGLGHPITLGSGVARAQELLRCYPSNELVVTDLRF